MPLAALRLIPTPKIKLRRTASQSVAVMFGKASAFAGLPPAPGPLRTRRRDKAADAVAGWPKKATKKSEKSEKWFFAIFQLEPAAAQSLPTEIGCGDFSDFSENSRGYTGGEGGEKRKDYEGRIKKSKAACYRQLKGERFAYSRIFPLVSAFSGKEPLTEQPR
jgi:hypothetical protein